MQKGIVLAAFFLFSAGQLVAQTRTLNGYIKDSLTHLPLAGATLSNNSKQKKVQTDANGFFSVPASPDDLLYALAVHYRYDTLRYNLLFQDTITIYLSPLNLLENVTIETGYKKYQSDSLQRRLEFEQDRGRTLSTVDDSKHKQTFGLTINLDRLFKRKYKGKQKEERVFNSLEQDAYVRFRFPVQTVAFYTGLRGETLQQFMRQYTPSYEWLRQHPAREQLIDYISEKLAAFRNRKSQ